MKNQISGSISLDVSSLAEQIAEKLKDPGAGLREVSREQFAQLLTPLNARLFGVESHTDATVIVDILRQHGYVLAQLPDAGARESDQPSWFTRSAD